MPRASRWDAAPPGRMEGRRGFRPACTGVTTLGDSCSSARSSGPSALLPFPAGGIPSSPACPCAAAASPTRDTPLFHPNSPRWLPRVGVFTLAPADYPFPSAGGFFHLLHSPGGAPSTAQPRRWGGQQAGARHAVPFSPSNYLSAPITAPPASVARPSLPLAAPKPACAGGWQVPTALSSLSRGVSAQRGLTPLSVGMSRNRSPSGTLPCGQSLGLLLSCSWGFHNPSSPLVFPKTTPPIPAGSLLWVLRLPVLRSRD